MDLATALGFAAAHPFVPDVNQHAPAGPKRQLTCSFDDRVQLIFCLENAPEAAKFHVSHDALHDWADKPWGFRTSDSGRLFGDPLSSSAVLISKSLPNQHYLPGDLSDGSTFTHNINSEDELQQPTGHWVPDARALPSWWRKLLELHDRHGVIECLEEGKVIYVCSWYLHGITLRNSQESRPVRLTEQWRDWLTLFQDVWHDRLLLGLPVELGVVQPHPPASVFQGHVAHVILGQDMHDEAPAIVTTLFRSSQRDALAQSAQLLPETVTAPWAIQAASATVQCAHRECRVYLGDSPLQEPQALVPLPFTSLVIEVFPESEDVDDFTSFMAAGTGMGPTRCPQLPIIDHPDAVRQGSDPEDDDPIDSNDTASDDAVWRQGIVFSIHAPPAEGLLNVEFHHVLCSNVARLAQIPRDDLAEARFVPYPPADLVDRELQVYLAQHRADIQTSSDLSLVLIDVEFLPSNEGESMTRVRFPFYLTSWRSRHQILHDIDVLQYALFVNDAAQVWHNQELLGAESQLSVRLRHGDFLRVVLSPPRIPLAGISTRCIARMLQMGVQPVDLEAFYWLSNVDEDLDPMPTQFRFATDVGSSQATTSRFQEDSLLQVSIIRHSQGRQITWHTCEDVAAIRLQYCQEFDPGPVLGQVRPNLDLPEFEAALFRLWTNYAVVGPGGVERQAKVSTWFNDHEGLLLCDTPRIVTLFEDVLEWRALLRRAWADLCNPLFEVHFFLVTPHPIDDRTEAIAHIVLLQRPNAMLKTTVVSVLDDAINGGEPRRWALPLPNQVDKANVIRFIGYESYCPPVWPRAICSVWYGDEEIVQPFALSHGFSLNVFVQRQGFHSWSSDSGLQLLQTGAKKRRLYLDTMLEELPVQPAPSTFVRLFAGVPYLELPTFVELHVGFCRIDLERELRKWGHDCHCAVFADWHAAVCFPKALRPEAAPTNILYLQLGEQHENAFLLDNTHLARDELGMMRFLYSKGFWRASISFTETDDVLPVSLIGFYNWSVPEAPIPQGSQGLKWPQRLPVRPSLQPLFIGNEQDQPLPQCRLELGITTFDIEKFFCSARNLLCTNFEGVDLPDHIAHALAGCESLDRVDRLLIYCDGSSIPDQRRRPPLRVDEDGKGDTWAFLVLAEEYTSEHTSKVNFVGWTAQPVIFAHDAQHYIGSEKVGSETSEREALFWCSLWRLSQNTNVPTTFCTDSLTSKNQGTGLHGTTDDSLSFRLLRSTFQSLESALDPPFLSSAHIAGHSGDPWNDLVDLLAKQERQGSFYHARQSIDLRQWQRILPHFWMVLGNDNSLPRFLGTCFDASPPALPPERRVQKPATRGQWSVASCHISFASGNVNSLYAGEDAGRGKVHFIRSQMRHFGFNFMGLQETRCAEICSCVDDIYRLGGGADHGHWGTELWIDLARPIAYVRKQPILLSKHDFVVLYKSPRLLLVRVDHWLWNALVVVAHAPQSGQSETDRAHWWQHFHDVLQQFHDGSSLFILLDANAAPGPADGCVVGKDHFPTSKSTHFLRDFLHVNDLCLPCTFDCHQGSNTTWTSLNGETRHCIDFVCVPRSLLSTCKLSTVLPEFDLCNGDADHRVVALQLEWQEHTWYQRPLKKKQKVDRSSINSQSVLPNLLKVQAPAWEDDIAHHIETYTQDLHHCLAVSCPPCKETGKKTFFPLSLWRLRDQKLAAKKRVTAIGGRYRTECLRAIFQQWSSMVSSSDAPSPVSFYNYAVTLRCWRLRHYVELKVLAAKLKRLLQQSRHAAMTEALKELPDTASANDILKIVKLFLGPTNVKHLKRKTLPMLLDEQGQPCSLPAQLLSRWITFFGDMEGGVRLDEDEQWAKWRSNLQRFRKEQFVLTLADIPSLTDLELAFRRVPRNKASGLDNVPSELRSACPTQLARQMYGALLKLVLHGQESLAHKGGLLTPAHKNKGSLTDPSAYRSLLVSSHLGKTLHRTVRQKQATLLETFMARSQLGGKRRVPVTLGLHEARAFLRAAACQHKSAVLLMVDLVEAFYRVLRPLALGSEFLDQDIAQMTAKLKMPPEVLHQLREHLAQPSAIMLAGMPLHYQMALQAIHEDTFFQMPGQEDVCRTSVGSRPGDSFADIVFTFLFSRVLQNFQQKLQTHDLQEFFHVDPCFDPFETNQRNQSEMHVHTGPVWMDDLCVTLSSDTAEGALHKAGVTSSLLMDTLEEHAMLPNLKKGKTELLISLRGPGVRAAKARFFGPCSTGMMPVVGEHAVRHITVVGEYQHLGGLLHHAGDHRKEMKRRVAQAHQAFSAHRRQIFQNRDLPLKKRTQLFESLVLTKLLYGCESWHLADQRSKSFLHSAVLRLYKRLLRVPHDGALTDEEVCVALSLPTPTELLRRARLRYIGTLHRCESTVAWGLLHADLPWCALVRDDLLWMWHQLRRSSSLSDPTEGLDAWRYLWQFHTSYWKGLIKRAIRHACLQRQNTLLVNKAHLDILDDLTQSQAICPGPLPQAMKAPPVEGAFGCMCCRKMFRSRAGEGAHMFRCHRLISHGFSTRLLALHVCVSFILSGDSMHICVIKNSAERNCRTKDLLPSLLLGLVRSRMMNKSVE